MNSSFLQSEEWFNFQKSLDRSIFYYNQDGVKARILKLPLALGKSYLYIPHGPEINFDKLISGNADFLKNFLQYLEVLSSEEKAIFIKAEPLSDVVAKALAEKRFKKSFKEMQSAKTVMLNLTKEEADLKKEMHQKTRYNIGVALKHGLEVKETADLAAFWELMRRTTERDRFYSHNYDYYRRLFRSFSSGGGGIKTKLFLAYYQNIPVAGAISLVHQKTGYYLHGASNHDYRKYMAPYLLHWQIIEDLKTRGVEKYDWWGIDANRWPGVTRFKLGWGGRVIEHPGSFDWPLSDLWYQGYKAARKFSRR